MTMQVHSALASTKSLQLTSLLTSLGRNYGHATGRDWRVRAGQPDGRISCREGLRSRVLYWHLHATARTLTPSHKRMQRAVDAHLV